MSSDGEMIPPVPWEKGETPKASTCKEALRVKRELTRLCPVFQPRVDGKGGADGVVFSNLFCPVLGTCHKTFQGENCKPDLVFL